MKPIAITPGDPAGIGPDIVLQWAQSQTDIPVVVIADQQMLAERATQLRLSLPSSLNIRHVPLYTACRAGYPEMANAPYVLETLQIAAEGCLAGVYSSMVTGPVNKALLNQAGIPFLGHTEWLAKLMDIPQTVMLFVTDTMKVALYTTHVPLSAVPHLIKADTLRNSLHVLRDGLKHYFHINNPHIAVCGLNPHAGENGYLGTEEISIIIPTLNALKKEGFYLSGPLPADTAFTKTILSQHDAILALYHDQGLPVIKSQGFGEAVNITLGLPIFRASVDHGTAFELAGTGHADPSSFKTAIELTAKVLAQ